MNILLIGKTGQLGRSLLAEKHSHFIYAPGRDELDLEEPESYTRIIADKQPDMVINTAAFHNVPQCEVDPLRAFSVNCNAIRDLAAVCKKEDVRLITFSTDYVFGGGQSEPYFENDIPKPIQMYGISKLAGEYAALATAPDHVLVIRTCGLYGNEGANSKGGSFVDNRIADAGNCSEIEMSCDQTISPTYTFDLANAVLKLADHPSRPTGICHLVNEGECTWYEFTKTIYELMNLDMIVRPVNRGGLSGEMRRPMYSVLANERARELGIVMPSWKSGLQRYLSQRNSSG